MTLRIGKRNKRGAFTLIELILVMALLVIVIAVTFPGLQGFFKGRALESETRRFASLARYGQSRAVSEGIPMALWINARAGTYGLEAQSGYLERDDKAVEYELDKDLEIEVTQTSLNRAQMTPEQQYRHRNQTAGRNANPEIRFAPDGSIDLISPESVCIRGEGKSARWIAQSENRLGYEVRTNAPNQSR